MVSAAAFCLLVGFACAGCSESRDGKLERAAAALNRNQPEQSLSIAGQLLADNPLDGDALELAATAQLHLSQFGSAQELLDQLVDVDPERERAHDLRMSTVRLSLESLLSNQAFAHNEAIELQFDEELSRGNQYVKWFEASPDRTGHGRFYRASLAYYDAQRWEILLGDGQLTAQLASTDSIVRHKARQQRDQYYARVDERWQLACAALRSVLDGDPEHEEGFRFYMLLLVRGRLWGDLWTCLDELANSKSLMTAPMVADAVEALSRVPDALRPFVDRAGIGMRLYEKLAKEQRSGPKAQLARAYLLLMLREWDEADELLRGLGDERTVRLARAEVAYRRQDWAGARDVIEAMIRETGPTLRLQVLLGLSQMRLGESGKAESALRAATRLDPTDASGWEGLLEVMVATGQVVESQPDVGWYFFYHAQDPRAALRALSFRIAAGRREEVRQMMVAVEKIEPASRLDGHLQVLADGYAFYGDYEKAQEHAEALLQRWPDSHDAMMRLARLLVLQDKDEELAQLVSSWAHGGITPMFRRRLLGQVLLEHHRYDAAVNHFSKMLDDGATDSRTSVKLAMALSGSGEAAKAYDLVQALLVGDNEDELAHAGAAWLRLHRDQAQAATRHIERIAEDRYEVVIEPVALAKWYVYRDQNALALSVCHRALMAGNADGRLRETVARLHARRGEMDAAWHQLNTLAHQYPSDRARWVLLKQLYLKYDDPNRGVNALNRMSSANPLLTTLVAGQMMVELGQPQRAEQVLHEGYENAFGAGDMLALEFADAIAALLQAGQRLAGARKYYEQLIEAGITVNAARWRLIDMEAGDTLTDTAVTHLRALARTANDDATKLRITDLLMRVRQFEPALQWLERWIQRQPRHVPLIQQRARVLVRLGLVKQAILILTAAVDAAPQRIEAWLALGQTYELALDFPAAEATYVRAAQAVPDRAWSCHAQRAQMYMRLGLWRVAAQAFADIDTPDHLWPADLAWVRARAHYRLKQLDEAKYWLANISIHAPLYPDAQWRMAQIAIGRGELDVAKQIIVSLAGDGSTAPALVRMLAAHRRSDRHWIQMFEWSHDAPIAALQGAQRVRWLALVAQSHDRGPNWFRLLDDVESILAVTPNDWLFELRRVLLKVYLGRREDLFQGLSAVWGELPADTRILLTDVLSLESVSVRPTDAVIAYIDALLRSDLTRAREVVKKLPSSRVYFAPDLIATLSQPDADWQGIAKATGRVALARLALDAQLPALAQEICEAEIRKYPQLHVAHALNVQAIFDMGQPLDRALARAQESIPEAHLTRYLVAHEHYRAGRLDESAAAFKGLIDEHPDNDHLVYELAMVLRESGFDDQAEPHLAQLARSGRSYALNAADDLAAYLARLSGNEVNRANRVVTQSLSFGAASSGLLDSSGWIAYRQGDSQRARDQLCKALLLQPTLTRAHYHQGVVYHDLDNPRWARFHLTAATEGDPSDPATAEAVKALDELTEPRPVK
ncbi:MAG: hypothetical protein CMJ21_06445 [Phycisphaerae bacterium]|nr:hypothetical protein [Phycisphaerae bacterium]